MLVKAKLGLEDNQSSNPRDTDPPISQRYDFEKEFGGFRPPVSLLGLLAEIHAHNSLKFFKVDRFTFFHLFFHYFFFFIHAYYFLLRASPSVTIIYQTPSHFLILSNTFC